MLLLTCASEQGKVIGVGIHMDQKKIELYFCDRLTFSNIRGRTSRRINMTSSTTASPEMLSSSSKLRISLFNAPCSICPKDDILTVAQFRR